MSDFRKCFKCDEVKHLSEYYVNGKSTYCVVCTKRIDKEKEYQKKLMNGGGLAIRQIPNTYTNEIQKNVLFELMYRLGWNFNESKGIWYKLPIKNEDGQFLNLRKRRKIVVYRSKDVNHKKPLTEENLKVINKIGELRNDGLTLVAICKIVKLSKPTVRKKLQIYYERRTH